MSNEHKFPYEWYLKGDYPAQNIEKHGLKVFSCFACGGGSTMGYKLAGYDVLGCNEIDPRMAECYIENHHPKYAFIEPIQEFKNRKDLPEELYNLDILDGSPPCSSFSIAGNREKDWGKEKKFREGQTKQVLDTLFFDFIDLAKELQPKVVIAENVKGILLGKAKDYVIKIKEEFRNAGYQVQHYLLNASKMGVPQKRQRVFFIALRNDIFSKFDTKLFGFKLNLDFNEKAILFKDISDDNDSFENLTELYNKYWLTAKEGQSVGKFATCRKLINNDVCYTLPASSRMFHPNIKRTLNDKEICLASSFPLDYNFLTNDCNYLCGMSVPPVMTAQISYRVYEQILSKL